MYESSLRTYRHLLLLTDALAALVAMGSVMRWTAMPLYPSMAVGAVVALLVGIGSMRGYDLTRVFRIANEVMSVLAGSLIALALLGGEVFFLNTPLSRQVVLAFGAVAVGVSLGLRVAIRQLYKWQRAPRLPRARVMVLGDGPLSDDVTAQLRERDWLGVELASPAPPLLSANEIERRVHAERIDAVVVTSPLEKTPGLSDIVERLHAQALQVYLLPELHPLAALPSRMEMFGGMALLSLSEQIMTPWQAAAKRALDILVSLVALIALLPLFALLTLLIRGTSRGPVLFAQERVGERGRRFRMVKFRTMVAGADQQMDEDGGPLAKRRDDPRVTPLGRWLRRFSLDELPQLWNILRGEMSLVGPRPELPHLVEQYEPWQRRRLLVPQGLTGWWQINGRSDKPMHLHTEDDLYYVRNFSLRLDLEILWKTVWVVLQGRGAY